MIFHWQKICYNLTKVGRNVISKRHDILDVSKGGKMEKKYTFDELIQIIEKLRSKDGCPWDREQTHKSLKNCMIEEAYEVVEAIDIYDKSKDYQNLCEELGDVLLQVVLHSQIGKEEGSFQIEDVITGICEKMIRRHPHVFQNTQVQTTEDVLKNWEDIKKEEKKEENVSQAMLSVPKALPANIRAEKIQKKAAKVGFDFINYEEALEKVYEELNELEMARKLGLKAHINEEFGDLMFSVVNLSRFLKLNAENYLTNATNKFINKFVDVENLAVAKKVHLDELSVDELNALWAEVK